MNSRMVLPLPMVSLVGSPPYFLSCGISPRLANWKMRLFSPMVVWPLITACGPISVFAPIRTFGPMTVYAPTLTLESSSALGSMTAVGWMRDTGFLSCLEAFRRPRRFRQTANTPRIRFSDGLYPARPSESQPFSTMRCAHMMVASQASSPFTLAVALNLPMPRRCASSSTSNTSWSPGTT